MNTNQISKWLTLCMTAITTPLLASQWNAGGMNTNWSDTSNWNTDPSGPQGTDVSFSSLGTTASSSPATNVVDSNQSILSLLYQYNSTVNFHTTEILEGVTLSVGGTALDKVFQVGGLSDTTASTTSVVIKGAGMLSINQAGGVIDIANHRLSQNYTSPARANLDMSGLAAFQANLGTTGAFNVGASMPTTEPGGHQATTSTVRLANTNTITAGILRVGSVIPSSQISISYDHPSLLYLGEENTLNVASIEVGRGYLSRAAGSIAFDDSVKGGESTKVVIRGANGIERVESVVIGVNAGGGTSNHQQGSIDFSGGEVDALISNLTIGSGHGTSGIAAGSLTMDRGVIDVQNVTVGEVRGGINPDITHTGTINVNGGQFIATDMILARSTTSSTNEQNKQATGILNISGSTSYVEVANGIRMGGHESAGSNIGLLTATINLTGGTLLVGGDIAKGSVGNIQSTINLDGGSLDLNGNNINVDTFNLKRGILRNVADFNQGATLVKTTAGVLFIEGNNTWQGTTVIEEGTVNLTGSLLNGNGIVADAAQFILSDTGTLQFNISGAATADLFQVEAGGDASFEGTLRFYFTGDHGDGSWQLFTGTEAENFNLLTIDVAGAYTGELSNMGGNIWGANVGAKFIAFDTSSGILSVGVIPEPGSFALIALGLIGFVVLIRRR